MTEMRTGYIIACTAILAAVAALPARAQACTSEEMAAYVKQMGYWEDPYNYDPHPMLQCYLEHGAEAAGLLVKELHVVEDSDFAPETYTKHRDALHVVWAIRSLRAITGIDQKGGSAQELKTRKPHKHLLDILIVDSGDQVRFFGVFMSHEHIVTAPQDIQKEIIGKWNDWYKTQGASFKYQMSTSPDFWAY